MRLEWRSLHECTNLGVVAIAPIEHYRSELKIVYGKSVKFLS